ncbi:FAD-dependent monooxygenase [Microbacterium sp. A93]|uniref:FAD-dependent monooxygenase n=1 Tax=Microbacterium sp. A93 TaxID=3450716 RepID=UPI003F43261C
MTAVDKVAVVGTGISGLAAAIQLARAGVVVDVFEANPELNALGSGISLQGNALRAFAELGVWEEARDAGFPFDGMGLRAPGPEAPVIARDEGGDGGEVVSGVRLPSAMGMPRADLTRILYENAVRTGARVGFGQRVTEVVSTEEYAEPLLESGSAGRYDLVIGADGLHSAVRSSLGITETPEHTGMGIWRAFVPRPAQVEFTELYYGGPCYIAGYTPTGADSMYAFLVSDAQDHFTMSAEDGAALMIEQSTAYGGPWEQVRADLAAGTAQVNYTWFTHHLVPGPWNRGRTVIIGDAAHSCPPTIAQGAAQGLEDALVLTELLVDRDAVDASLWEAFHERRLPRAAAIVEASMQLAEWQRDGQDHSADVPRLLADVGQRVAVRA